MCRRNAHARVPAWHRRIRAAEWKPTARHGQLRVQVGCNLLAHAQLHRQARQLPAAIDKVGLLCRAAGRWLPRVLLPAVDALRHDATGRVCEGCCPDGRLTSATAWRLSALRFQGVARVLDRSQTQCLHLGQRQHLDCVAGPRQTPHSSSTTLNHGAHANRDQPATAATYNTHKCMAGIHTTGHARLPHAQPVSESRQESGPLANHRQQDSLDVCSHNHSCALAARRSIDSPGTQFSDPSGPANRQSGLAQASTPVKATRGSGPRSQYDSTSSHHNSVCILSVAQ